MIKNREFLNGLIRIAMPIALQNFLTSLLNMIDTMMIGSLGDLSVAAVGLANQMFFILSLVIFKGDYISSFSPIFTNLSVALSVIYLAVISSILAFMLYNFATSTIDLVSAASFSSVIPICSVLAGIFLLQEALSPFLIILCALIIFCVYMVNKGSAEK